MCVAELNASLTGCNHRWYHLIRPCVPGTALRNCPSKLALEGWEIKCDFCPFCAGWPLDTGDFMILGSQPHSRSNSFSSPLSRTSSLTTSVAAARRESRRGSVTRSDSGLPAGSPVFAASERNKAMNQRVDSYFAAVPEAISETQRTRPGTSTTGWGTWNFMAEEKAEQELRRESTTSTSSSASKTDAMADKAGKVWQKARRRSSGFKNFFQ